MSTTSFDDWLKENWSGDQGIQGAIYQAVLTRKSSGVCGIRATGDQTLVWREDVRSILRITNNKARNAFIHIVEQRIIDASEVDRPTENPKGNPDEGTGGAKT